MNGKGRILLIISAWLVAFNVGGPAFAQSETDEARLKSMQREANDDAVKRGQKMQTELLAKQFQIPTSEIEKLRNAGQGWGEVTIRLALADRLAKTDPSNFPTLTGALDRIATLRNDGRGWGNISKELGFKLGPIVSDVRHSLNDLRRDVRVEQLRTSKMDVNGTAGDMKREAQLERLDRVQRPERPERSERPERPERPQRPERPEKPERIGR